MDAAAAAAAGDDEEDDCDCELMALLLLLLLLALVEPVVLAVVDVRLEPESDPVLDVEFVLSADPAPPLFR